MRTIILGFLILITTAGYSQKNQTKISCNEKALGKSLIDSSAINGFEYIFPDRIHKTFLDTTTNFLTVQLRGLSKNGKWLNNTGSIIQYDIKNQKVLWNKKIAYQTSNLQQFSNMMIYTVGNKSFCLDVNTGNERWEIKNNIYFVDPIDNIGIGYKFKSLTHSNELEGIDLRNGNILWKRDLNREYGWNDVFYINDSTIIVVAAGLHAINIKTGKGWDYNTITGEKDYTGTAAKNAIGVAAGLLTGTFAISTGYDLIRNLVSNTIIDSTNIYIASKEQIAKIDKHTGEIVWKFPFPDSFASKSSIFMNDSVIFVINKGMAYMGYRQLNFGTPFFAAFNRQTSEQIFLSTILVKNDPILSFDVLNEEVFLIFKNRIMKYSMEEGFKEAGFRIEEKEFPKDNFGELKYFVGNQAFITSQNGDLLSLHQSDSTNVFVYTSQGKILSIDKELNITKTLDSEDLSIYYQRTKDFKFIAKDKNTFIVNNDGKKIAEIGTTSKAFLIGNTLYDTQDKSFIAIDLEIIIDNE